MTNVEWFQYIKLSDNGLEASSPLPTMFPRMQTEPDAKAVWLSKFSNFASLSYTLIKAAVSLPPTRDAFLTPRDAFLIPRVLLRKALRNQVSFNAPIFGTTLKKLINAEYHEIPKMISFKSTPPDDLLGLIFERLSRTLNNQKYPSELVHEFSKSNLMTALLDEIATYLRQQPHFRLTHPKQFEIETGGKQFLKKFILKFELELIR